MTNFALIGVGGYIAPRHLQAIHETGSQLLAAVDKNDSVGVLDRYFPDARFFTEIERFDRFMEKQRRTNPDERIEWVSICTPNYLHDSHIRLALRVNANAICEKPLVINPWNLDQLAEIEAETGGRVYTILQLRLHPDLIALRQRLIERSTTADVTLTYISHRGPWYHVSWKGVEEKSGGVAMNIGIHFFDLLLWLFGPAQNTQLHLSRPNKMAGTLELERARVRWFLSVDRQDLPAETVAKGKSVYRSITVDGEEVEFSEGFTGLHTRVYEETLAGRGFTIEDSRPSIDLVHAIRHSDIALPRPDAHPFLKT